MITAEQYERLKPIKVIYDIFKRMGDSYISAENVMLVKEVAREFGMTVSQECTSCAPELLLRLIRHHYMPYEEEMRKDKSVTTKTRKNNGRT